MIDKTKLFNFFNEFVNLNPMHYNPDGADTCFYCMAEYRGGRANHLEDCLYKQALAFLKEL
jgi:hypothetical protein